MLAWALHKTARAANAIAFSGARTKIQFVRSDFYYSTIILYSSICKLCERRQTHGIEAQECVLAQLKQFQQCAAMQAERPAPVNGHSDTTTTTTVDDCQTRGVCILSHSHDIHTMHAYVYSYVSMHTLHELYVLCCLRAHIFCAGI